MSYPVPARATLVKGPATIAWNSLTIITKDDFEVRPLITVDDTPSSFFGRIDSVVTDVMWEFSFTPLGVFTAGMIAGLWDPVLNFARGRSIFGTSDKDVVIHASDGMKLTLAAAGISAVPDLFFGVKDQIFGQMTMQAIGADATEWTDAAKRYVLETAAHAGYSLTRSTIIKGPYKCTWGAAPFDAFDVKAGVRVSAQLSFLADDESNNAGRLDRCLDSVLVSARGEPVGVTAADLLERVDMQGAGFERGAPVSALAGAADLVVDGLAAGTPKFTLYNAAALESSLRFGAANRVGEVRWRGAPDFSGTAFGAPCAITVNAAS